MLYDVVARTMVRLLPLPAPWGQADLFVSKQTRGGGDLGEGPIVFRRPSGGTPLLARSPLQIGKSSKKKALTAFCKDTSVPVQGAACLPPRGSLVRSHHPTIRVSVRIYTYIHTQIHTYPHGGCPGVAPCDAMRCDAQPEGAISGDGGRVAR